MDILHPFVPTTVLMQNFADVFTAQDLAELEDFQEWFHGDIPFTPAPITNSINTTTVAGGMSYCTIVYM